jgi:solute carrier family 25 phosphate transporter 3
MRDASFYGKCSVGGILSCGLTHAAVVSLDVHKCRSQANPGKWPAGLPTGLRKLAAEEGLRGLTTGWAPTLWGYGAQGLCKFGLNEFFQDIYAGMIGGRDKLDTTVKKMGFQAAASGSAEIFADVALCPWEMTKVRMQVELPPGTEYRGMGTMAAMSKMSANSANTNFPFGSLKPLWGRQVPYTIIKFVCFYQTAEFIYEQLDKKMNMKKSEMSKGQCLGVTFAAGYWAGIFCAVATQPMDNLVSMAGNQANKGKSFGQMAGEVGMVNLFTKGLGTRIIMVGTLTGLQWWIYGSFKSAMGFGTQ